MEEKVWWDVEGGRSEKRMGQLGGNKKVHIRTIGQSKGRWRLYCGKRSRWKAPIGFRPISLPCRPQRTRREIAATNEKSKKPALRSTATFCFRLFLGKRREEDPKRGYLTYYLINSPRWAPRLGPTFPSGDCPATGESCPPQPKTGPGVQRRLLRRPASVIGLLEGKRLLQRQPSGPKVVITSVAYRYNIGYAGARLAYPE